MIKLKHGSEGNVISHFDKARRYGIGALCGLMVFGAAACNSDTAPQIDLNKTGSLTGLLYFDANGDGNFDPSAGDSLLPNVKISVLERGTTSTLAGGSGTTDASGRFTLASVPIGSHSLSIDTTGFNGTVVFCQNPLPVDVFISESQFVSVNGKTGCLVTIFVAESKPLKTPVTVSGTVTSSTGQISANTTYIEDATGGIQVFGSGLGTTLNIGEVVEIQGVLDTHNNETEVTNPKVNSRSAGTPLVPVVVTTKAMQDAGASAVSNLQGRLVTVKAAMIKDGFTSGGNRNVAIDDGSGGSFARLESLPFPTTTPATTLPATYPVGHCYDITGIVRAFSTPSIELVPRSASDIVEVTCKS